MEGLGIGEIFPGTIAPVLDQLFDHLGYGQVAAVIGAEIPCAGILFGILRKKGTEPQVAADGFQDVLPRPDSMGTAPMA